MRRLLGLVSIAVIFMLPLATQAVDFTAHGYLRTRTHALWDLDTQKASALGNDRFGLIQYNQMRLRVEPTLKVNDHLSLHTQFDILDNIAFGSTETDQLELHDPIIGTFTLPAGAGTIGTSGSVAGENGSINIRRAWMDIQFPLGKLRIGRQPSHWGLGIFQNDGNQNDADFGDTSDRILLITQKQFANNSAFSIGAAWDIAYESQRDPRIGGLSSAIRSNGQDTNQWAMILLYERPEVDFGVFGGIRKRDGSAGSTTQACALNQTAAIGDTVCTASNGGSRILQDAGTDGNTLVYFADAYTKVRYGDYHFGAEYVFLGGKISTGVAIDGINFSGISGSGIIALPAQQDLFIHMAAAEVGAEYDWGGEWLVQGGIAPGDESPLSQRITQYGFRPDYQIGLLMFHYPMGTSPRLRDGTTGNLLTGGVPITGNFINNAYYAGVTYKHNFDIRRLVRKANEFKVGMRVVSAWAHANPVSLDFGALLGDTTQFPTLTSRGKWYGVEGDVMVEARFFDKLRTNLEFGVLVPRSAYDINVNMIDPGGIVSTIPADKANIAYGARLSIAMDF